ncbi:SH3 domain-containing protein [Streptomyces sp. NBC_01304]|uniref:SH3 domain-containing protein n=1 Tax=Streptomyces sp. NBC_01304 TaxID=2903818 RepID=UPI002E13C0EB|nr:SH3 domain-containing protein [Streptomyces sp. NBC_01304]
MAAIKRLATVALSVSLLAGGAAAVAPTASAASSKCEFTNYGAANGNGINFRTGPSTGYVSKGLLYKDKLHLYCSKNGWYKAQLPQRSKSGLKKGTWGWIHSSKVKLHLAGG